MARTPERGVLGRMLDVKEGDVLAGKYRIERVLGEGGMGIVVAAVHLQLDERVAIKFLLPGALRSPEAVARFAREARAAVKIKSEHVARVSDVGTLETGAPYMVMEYLQGRDLAVLVHESGPLPPDVAVEYVLQACEALAEAHALGIVHRDLKPANLFLASRADGSPCVKVLDFGISKLTNASSSGADLGMTKTQAVMGSPLYMSPEQMSSSRNVDARADIWAVGAILYELVTGSVPFQADTMPQLCGMILQEAPPPPRSRRLDVPEGLERAILRCLEKNRDRRFANVAELAVALAPFAPRNGTRSAQRIAKVLNAAGVSTSTADALPASVHPNSATDAVTGGATDHTWGRTLSKTGSRALWVALGLGLMAGGGVLALFVVPRLGPAPVSSESSASPPPPSVETAPPPAPTPVVVPPPPAPSVTTVVAPSASAPSVEAPETKPAPHARPSPARPSRPEPQRPAATAKPAAKPADASKPIDPLAGRR